MLEVSLPLCYSSFFLMAFAPVLGGARTGPPGGRASREQAMADKFLVRLRAVAAERLERDLDDMWRRNNIRRLCGCKVGFEFSGAGADVLCRLVCDLRPDRTALMFMCIGHEVTPRVVHRMLCFHLPVETQVDVQVWPGSRVSGVRRVNAASANDSDVFYDAARA